MVLLLDEGEADKELIELLVPVLLEDDAVPDVAVVLEGL